MKKFYVKPAVEVCEILPYTLLEGSNTQGESEKLTTDNEEYEW